MSHHTLNNFLHHPNISNLVELYEPIRYFGRTLRTGQEKPLISDGHFRTSVHHETGFSPDFDLRETSEAYFLEGEFPGISGGSAIKLQWLDERTLRVEGTIHKTDLKTEWGVDLAENRPQDQPESPQYGHDVKDEDKRPGELVAVQGPEQRVDGAKTPATRPVTVKTWLNERRDGLCTRSFSFPAPVNIDAVQARLSRGVLRIMVPKVNNGLFKTKEIHVESLDNE
jgi:HSP20 family molecular chaperone IbpA